jgi:hypothetical protein
MSSGIDTYVTQALESFTSDPPDTEFQRGYLSAMLTLAVEGLGWPDIDPRLVAAGKTMREGG